MNKYELKPKIKIDNFNVNENINNIISKSGFTLIETYPGIRVKEITKLIQKNNDVLIVNTQEFALKSKQEFRKWILEDLTEDRVFGKFNSKNYSDVFDLKKIKSFISNNQNKNIVFIGLCSYLFATKNSKQIYIDLPRWEIQLRYRNNEKVYFGNSIEKETLKNFKRGYFIEWRMADRIKKLIWNKIDYFIDGSNEKELKIINKKTLDMLLSNASKRPFRLVPYFDAGVWGGKWMEKKFNLGTNKHSKWAWGFDGVPEENSIIFINDKNQTIEMPAMNLVLFEPRNLLGERVQNRFGDEFPIRFDFLDTINGGNLSMQVHPTTQYIRDKFNAPYTQEESYYILDIDKDADPACYLGMKNGVSKKELISKLNDAQEKQKFNVDKYINKFSVKKHDHINHPAGCIHSSAKGCMVLEISTTPYIFTFKLWDWGRVDFDGKPRPINIKHGEQVIDEYFNTDVCKKECVSPIKTIFKNGNVKEERTGLHPRQFIETRRFTINKNSSHVIKTHNSVNMLNLVAGDKAIVESVDGSFESLEISFAETFIVPESCKEFKIKSITNKSIKMLQAFVRTNS